MRKDGPVDVLRSEVEFDVLLSSVYLKGTGLVVCQVFRGLLGASFSLRLLIQFELQFWKPLIF